MFLDSVNSVCMCVHVCIFFAISVHKEPLEAFLCLYCVRVYCSDSVQWHMLHCSSPSAPVCGSEWQESGDAAEWVDSRRTKIWRRCSHVTAARQGTGKRATASRGLFLILFVCDNDIAFLCAVAGRLNIALSKVRNRMRECWLGLCITG
jgi:hypothetical protein